MYTDKTNLHVVHGISELLQLMCRAQGLQSYVSQLPLLQPEFWAQLWYCSFLRFSLFRRLHDPAEQPWNINWVSQQWGVIRSWVFAAYTEEVPEAEVLRDGDSFSPPSPTSWGIFGELGAEESGVAISSMSEYVLEPFLMLNALLKELLSCREDRRTD